MSTLLLDQNLTLKDHTGAALDAQQLVNRLEGLAFCITDASGIFVEINEAYTKLYGYAEEELIGNHFTMVVPKEYRPYLAQLHTQFINGEEEIPTEYTVQKKDGSLVRIVAEAVRIEDDNEGTSKLTVIDVLEN